jgi:hypothetical protein
MVLPVQWDYHQLTTREIMIKLFGWTPARIPDRPGGISFDISMIGTWEYRKPMVSVSRFQARRHRGLMMRGPFSTRHCPTKAGREHVVDRLNG